MTINKESKIADANWGTAKCYTCLPDGSTLAYVQPQEEPLSDSTLYVVDRAAGFHDQMYPTHDIQVCIYQREEL